MCDPDRSSGSKIITLNQYHLYDTHNKISCCGIHVYIYIFIQEKRDMRNYFIYLHNLREASKSMRMKEGRGAVSQKQ